MGVFGWDVETVDGHDYGALYRAFTRPRAGRPLCLIASTVKGKGVSFIEDQSSGTTRCLRRNRSIWP